MSNCKSINDLPDEILMQILSLVPVWDLVRNVENVCIRWQYLVRDAHLWRHLVYRPVNPAFLCEEAVKFFKAAPHLKYFVVPPTYKQCLLQPLTYFCKDIRTHSVHIDSTRSEIFERFVLTCQHLEELTIYDNDFSATSSLKIVSKALKLERLILVGGVSNVDRNIFWEISHGCPSLVGLDIKGLNGYTRYDLDYLLTKKSSKITSLSLKCCIEEQDCSLPIVFKHCHYLKSLYVTGHLGREDFTVDFTVLMKLHLKTLCMTDFWCMDVNDFLQYFKNGPVQELTKLDLTCFRNFDMRLGKLIFEKCVNLKHLNLEACEDLADYCLEPISNFKYLEYLNLNSCFEITDTGVKYIIKCRYIKYLMMNNCPLVTTKGFALCCENLKMLRALFMEDCIVKAKDLLIVPEKLPYLKILRVFWKRMDHTAIDNLLQRVPKLKLRGYYEYDPTL